MNMKRLLWGFLMSAAVALAGCSSDGGPSLKFMDGSPVTQDAIQTLETQAAEAAKMRDEYKGKVNAATTAITSALGAAATDDLAADIATLHGRLTGTETQRQTAQDALDALQTALGADSTSQEDLTAAVTALETMRDNYMEMVAAVQGALGLGDDATQAAILAAIDDLDMSDDPFVIAQRARAMANAAETKAETARKTAADKSAMLKGLEVMGSSAMAQANAQAVLDAEMDAKDALADAKEALESAQGALPVKDGTANPDEAKNALEAAIEVAKKAVMSVQDDVGSVSLEDAVEAVKGTKGDRTPAYHAEDVAKDVQKALQGTTTVDHANVISTDPHVASSDRNASKSSPTYSVTSKNNDSQGKTWGEIVGASKLVDMTIANRTIGGTGTETVKAISANGMSVNLALPSGTPTTYKSGTTQFNDDGPTNTTIVNYRGIPGSIICGGSDCETSADPSTTEQAITLTGSWYFAPSDASADYVRVPSSSPRTYTPDTLYAHYGYWLSGTNNDITDVHLYAYSAGASTAVGDGGGYQLGVGSVTVTGGSDVSLTDEEATYTGDAVGISTKRSYDSSGAVVKGSRESGEFTADVTLVVGFGGTLASPDSSIKGTITNFTGEAVDPSWTVQLQSNAANVFGDGKLNIDGNNNLMTGNNQEGKTVAAGVALGAEGYWTATAYGVGATIDTDLTDNNPAASVAGERPAGIFGTFDARFSNGEAAGAYATRKD